MLRKLLEGLRQVGLEAVEVSAEDVRLGEVIHELTRLFGANQAGHFEFLHVVRQGCRRDINAIAHGTTRGTGPLHAEFLEDLVAPRISESAGNKRQLIFAELDGLGGGSHGG